MDWQSFGIGAGVAVPLIGVIWRQLNERIKDHKADCDKQIAALWDQIGRDSISGMRKIVHSVGHLPEKFMAIDRELEELKRRGR
jgi:hypothetical protein